MKIVCDNCGAKYSIADEKVAGKVFKIRCKKCTGVIVVRGDQKSTETGESVVTESTGGEGVWHVVVEGEQQGPFTPAKVGELLASGTIDWEAYVWREGFESWQVARDVAELVDAVMGSSSNGQDIGGSQNGMMGADPFQSAQASPSASKERDAGRSPFAGGAEVQASAAGGGPFGASPFGADVGGGASSGRGAADLFATGGSASPFDAGSDEDDVVASMPSPRVSVEQSLTGQRNENSVLFSLANLQALATGSAAGPSPGPGPGPVPSAAPKASGGGAGMASGAGSGLIDIKALAGAASSPSGPRRSEDRVDDLLSIGAGGGLGSALAGPVLAPVVEPEKSNRKLLIGVAVFAGVCLLAATVAIAIVVTREPEQVATTAGGPNQPTGGTPTPGPSTPTPAPTDPSQIGAAGTNVPPNEVGTRTGDPGTADTGEGDEAGSRSRGSKRSRGARTGTGPAAAGATPAEESGGATGPATAGARRGNDDIDSLLEAALGSKQGSKRPSGGESAGASGGGDLPETPPRTGVASALQSVSGEVRACGGGQHGTAMAAVTIQGSTGRVTNVSVTGQFQGTPIGSCVARAVRGARFPRFSRPTFQVSFPYRL